jgi:D-alanyl-D-alanine endopeptidase (penicillin-binding protein 7)
MKLRALAITAALLLAAAPAGAASYSAVRTSGETTIDIDAGTSKTVTFKFKNNGSLAWKKTGKGYVSLYATKPYGRSSVFRTADWKSRLQPAVFAEAGVKPGATGTFSFTIHAPETPGAYLERFQLAAENTAWVYGGTVRLTVNVHEPTVTEKTPVNAKAWIAMDAETGAALIEQDADAPRSIASITKLMTSLVVSGMGPDLDKVEIMKREDEVGGGRLRMSYGTKLYVRDLFASTLVASANNSANALARSTGIARPDFVGLMNLKATELGLVSTRFADPTGIEAENISTAREVAKMSLVAFHDPLIAGFVGQPTYHIVTADGNGERNLTSTNRLVDDAQVQAIAGKTGFTYEAGYALTTILRHPGKRDVLVVTLGSDSQRRSFRDAKAVAMRAWAREN